MLNTEMLTCVMLNCFKCNYYEIKVVKEKQLQLNVLLYLFCSLCPRNYKSVTRLVHVSESTVKFYFILN